MQACPPGSLPVKIKEAGKIPVSVKKADAGIFNSYKIFVQTGSFFVIFIRNCLAIFGKYCII